MKKFFICTAFALLTLASCQKDLSTNVTEQQPSNGSNAALASNRDVTKLVSNTSNGDVIVRIDLTGQQATVPNPCTGGPLTFLSGILQLNIAPDGYSIRSTVITNLVIQDADGTIYHGVYVATFEQKGSPFQGTFSNTYKLILNPQGGGTNVTLHGILIITVNSNGVLTAIVDKFTLDCH